MATVKKECSSSANYYCKENFPPDVLDKLEAGAFRNLVEHLQERSSEVQNIDLMALSGFCRNCLAKWIVVEARKLSDDIDDTDMIQRLNALGYDEAAEYVYAMDYKDWKKRHAKKATEEQLQKLDGSKPLHAKHDKEYLKTRSEKPSVSLLSNVCCTNEEDFSTQENQNVPPKKTTSEPLKLQQPSSFAPPPIPEDFPVDVVNIAVLIVSDRASSGQYETGDLGGPAVQQAIEETLSSSPIKHNICNKEILPDDVGQIQSKLQQWSQPNSGVHLILTTGGTGFGKRDVTPEATKLVVDFTECTGLMTFVLTECSKTIQPLSVMSRATTGYRNQTMIANLPGNPRGVQEIIPLLLPLLLHAIKDIL